MPFAVQGDIRADSRRICHQLDTSSAVSTMVRAGVADGGGRRGNGASRLGPSRGAFLWSETEAGMAEIEKELRHYQEAGEPRAALEFAGQTQATMVDLKFCDLLGTWQHVSLPIGSFDESAFDEGLGFDGSSIRGWQGISESDMLLMPDPSTA